MFLPLADFTYLVFTGMPATGTVTIKAPHSLLISTEGAEKKKEKTANVGKKEDTFVGLHHDSAVFS